MQKVYFIIFALIAMNYKVGMKPKYKVITIVYLWQIVIKLPNHTGQVVTRHLNREIFNSSSAYSPAKALPIKLNK